MSGEGGDLTAEEREKHWQWVVGILRTYGVADHQAGQIAEALLDDGMVAATVAAARVAAARAEVTAQVEELAASLERDGFALVRWYGDRCPRCHTQPNCESRAVGHTLRAALSSAPTYEAPMDRVEPLVAEIDLRESIAQAIEALRPPYYTVGNWPNGYRKAVEDAAGLARGGSHG